MTRSISKNILKKYFSILFVILFGTLTIGGLASAMPMSSAGADLTFPQQQVISTHQTLISLGSNSEIPTLFAKSSSDSRKKTVHVSAYRRKDGTKVKEYYRRPPSRKS